MSGQSEHPKSSLGGMKPTSLLSRLTIVVFTRSRPAYARGQADFWGGRAPTLVILDNGAESWSDDVISSLSDNVHYSHEAGGYYRQMRQSGELIETEYAVLIDDTTCS